MNFKTVAKIIFFIYPTLRCIGGLREGRSGKPSVRSIKQWLLTRYLFRRNVLTGFYELESRFVLDGKYPDWVRIDDNIENSIWSEMDESGMHLPEKTLHNIINSDFSEPFDT